MPVISTEYVETAKQIIVTTYRNKKPVCKAITDLKTGITTVEVYKEFEKKPVETYVYNKAN